MPLLFSNPALLLGALGAALPVIIHFLSRRRVRKQPFSDLRFLDEVQARQARRMGIRRWLILLLRVLAILLLVLAAAGPRWGGVAGGPGQDRAVLFVIDTSASMNTQTADGDRLDQALVACASMINALPAGAAVQVITSGSLTQALFGDWLPAGTGAVQGLAGVLPSDGLFRVDKVLELAAVQVARAPSARVEMVWLSDLQPVDRGPEIARAAARLQEAGTVQHLVRPVGQATPGGGVVALELPGRALSPAENVTLHAMVTTRHPEEVVVLELDGRPVAEAVVAEPAAAPVRVSFSLSVPEAGLHQGLVRRPSDAFPADDGRPFVLEVPATIPVLLVHGRDRAVDPPTGRGGWRLLAAALSPGADPGLFRVTAVSGDRLAEGDLARHKLLVLLNPDPLGRRALEAMREFLEQGGGVLALLGDPSQADYYEDTLLPALGFAGPVNRPAESGNSGGPVPYQRPRLVDTSHPVFQGLEGEALGTLEDVRWRRWFRLPDGDARVLLQLTDDSPLLLEKDQGQGLVVLMPSDLSQWATDLAASSMALPLFQRLAGWLVGNRALGPAGNVPVGATLAVSPPMSGGGGDLDRSEELLMWLPGEEGARPAELSWRGGRPILTGGVAARAGQHVFTVAGDTVGLVAASVPAPESTLELMDFAGWRGEMASWGLDLTAQLGEDPGQDLARQLSGRSLAPWFFLAAFLVLLVELTLARHAGTSQASG